MSVIKEKNKDKKTRALSVSHNVEYFHIYTDEKINGRHIKGLEYLLELEKTWDFSFTNIVLIDNYNPTKATITAAEILRYLKKQGVAPDYWAFEKDMVKDANILLDQITNNRLKRNYLRYIEQHNKYPCSLLTAVWYLKRLGYIEIGNSIRQYSAKKPYEPTSYLLNVLPHDYSQTEARSFNIIKHSAQSEAIFKIQDIFYPVDSGRAQDLF